jgi:hypothetical protein
MRKIRVKTFQFELPNAFKYFMYANTKKANVSSMCLYIGAAEFIRYIAWTSKTKVAGSIPTEARPIFQPVRCGYILRVTSQ